MKLKIAILVFVSLTHQTHAQKILSLQETIAITLQNNYNIKLAKNNVNIAKNNTYAGKWQMAPNVSTSLNLGGGIQNSVLTTSTGAERIVNGAENYNMGYGINLGWTIFDGFQMYTNHQKLKELEKLGAINSKASIINTVAEVIAAYYNLALQQKLEKENDSLLKISQFRIQNANTKLSLGKGSKLEVLNAQVDYNTDTTTLIKQRNAIKIATINLNKLMARNLEIEFKVDETFDIDSRFNFSETAAKTNQLNPELEAAIAQVQIAKLNLKQSKGMRYPLINLNTGYTYNQSRTPTGFNQKAQVNGINYGLSVSLPIFNGFLQKQRELNAAIEVKNAELNLSKSKDEIQASLLSAYQNYQTYQSLCEVESRNVEIAKQNLNITLDKYTLGNIAAIVLREAQNNALEAKKRLMEVQLQTKLAEITLKQISGTLNLE